MIFIWPYILIVFSPQFNHGYLKKDFLWNVPRSGDNVRYEFRTLNHVKTFVKTHNIDFAYCQSPTGRIHKIYKENP